MDELTIIQIKELIADRLSILHPDCSVETELKRLFDEPEAKIVIMYNSSIYSKVDNRAGFLNRIQDVKFTIMLTVRDPLQTDLALKHLEAIRTIVHGLRVGPADENRLYPENDRFEEFTEGSEVWAFKIDFGFSKIARISEENADA